MFSSSYLPFFISSNFHFSFPFFLFFDFFFSSTQSFNSFFFPSYFFYIFFPSLALSFLSLQIFTWSTNKKPHKTFLLLGGQPVNWVKSIGSADLNHLKEVLLQGKPFLLMKVGLPVKGRIRSPQKGALVVHHNWHCPYIQHVYRQNGVTTESVDSQQGLKFCQRNVGVTLVILQFVYKIVTDFW